VQQITTEHFIEPIDEELALVSTALCADGGTLRYHGSQHVGEGLGYDGLGGRQHFQYLQVIDERVGDAGYQNRQSENNIIAFGKNHVAQCFCSARAQNLRSEVHGVQQHIVRDVFLRITESLQEKFLQFFLFIADLTKKIREKINLQNLSVMRARQGSQTHLQSGYCPNTKKSRKSAAPFRGQHDTKRRLIKGTRKDGTKLWGNMVVITVTEGVNVGIEPHGEAVRAVVQGLGTVGAVGNNDPEVIDQMQSVCVLEGAAVLLVT
jgi:hypothetical protein